MSKFRMGDLVEHFNGDRGEVKELPPQRDIGDALAIYGVTLDGDLLHYFAYELTKVPALELLVEGWQATE
jgi:hypothetical protein